MNESDLEKELRSLSPRKPSDQLAERIAADIQSADVSTPEPAAGVLSRRPKQRVVPVFLRPWFLALSGAVVVVIGLFAFDTWNRQVSAVLASRSKTTPAAVAALNEAPDQSVDELIAATDEGLVYDQDQEPQRQVRIQYLERHTWTNPQTGAVIEFEVPREDIVLMPVAMQ